MSYQLLSYTIDIYTIGSAQNNKVIKNGVLILMNK